MYTLKKTKIPIFLLFIVLAFAAAIRYVTLPKEPNIKYYSFAGQDKWIEPYVKKQNGVYVEFGVVNGIRESNTAYFAFKYNWTGVLVEPDIRFGKDIKTNRPEAKVYAGVAVCPKGLDTVEFVVSKNKGHSGIASEFQDPTLRNNVEIMNTSMKCIDLNEICPRQVDLMSIDTEGSELSILKTFDFQSHQVNIFQIEVKFGNQNERLNEKRVTEFMQQKGYYLLKQIHIGSHVYDNFYRSAK